MFETGLEQTNEVNRGILPSESRGPLLGKVLILIISGCEFK